jgi:UDP-3-O-[3-hydroxymyristoyl] glucosamine N-acyltransferase
MATSLATLAQLVGGQVVGDADVCVCGAATLLDAALGDITLVDKTEKADQLAASKATAAVIPAGLAAERLTMPAIRVDDVHRAFTLIVAHFRPPRRRQRTGVSPAAIVSPWARIAANVEIHPGASIAEDVEIASGVTIHSGARVMAGCKLAENVTIYPNAVLYENTIVGARSIIHAGAILGAHGFGYKFVEGRHQPSAQLGYVVIGADVEIGAATTVDRGTYGPTIIGEGTKIDNMVMIAHNCHIGRHNMICSQVGIAGSSTTGDYVVVAGQVGVRDHVRIGDGAVLGAKAGVSNDVPAGAHMLGVPATTEREQKIIFAALAKLPQMRHQLKALQHIVDQMTGAKPSPTLHAPDEQSGAAGNSAAA